MSALNSNLKIFKEEITHLRVNQIGIEKESLNQFHILNKLTDMNLRQETTINEVKMLLKENNIRMVYRLLGVGPSPELKKALENEEDHQIWEMFAKTNSNKI